MNIIKLGLDTETNKVKPDIGQVWKFIEGGVDRYRLLVEANEYDSKVYAVSLMYYNVCETGLMKDLLCVKRGKYVGTLEQ